jgi:SAM-dependent methyltransferase
MPPNPLHSLTADIEEEMRFAVPGATVAYPGEERDSMPDLGPRNIVRLPLEARGQEAVDALERLRDHRCEYLVVPRTLYGWLEVSPVLRGHLEREYSTVIDSESCRVYALHRVRDYDGPHRVGEDGLPLPPPYLIRMTSGCIRQALTKPTELYRNFWSTGLRGSEAIREILTRNGCEIAELGSILDFGSGCGRIIRHWHGLEGPSLYGSDYNPYLVEWCAESLPFAEFRVNDLVPPLDFDDDSFDLLYAFSVFSHFDVDLQLEWMAEVTRVVRPGGLILITVPGARWADHLAPEDRERFMAGEPVVLMGDQGGTNACTALSPERHIRETLAGGLRVVDLVPDGAPDVRQDAVLLEKPERA